MKFMKGIIIMQKLRTYYVALEITTVCTLKCKLCSACIPYFKEQSHFNTDEVLKSVDKLFNIYEYIEKLDISGGETLTHPDLIKILKKVYEYKENIGFIRIITNGTIVPSEELIKLLASDEKFILILDDYGELSKNKNKVLKLVEENNINLKLNIYQGNDQLCGGWVDYGDFEKRNYTELETKKLFRNCFAANWMCLTVVKGKLYQCIRSAMGVELGFFNERETGFVNLLDDSISTDKKIEMAACFGKQPVEACYYCNSFDSENSERFPAAEQVK